MALRTAVFLILITVCYSVIVKEGAWTLDDVAKDNRTRASFYPVPDTGTEISHQMYTAFRCKKCKEPIAVPADVFYMHSAASIDQYNFTVREVVIPVQTVVNPYGVVFDVINFQKSSAKHAPQEWGLSKTLYPGWFALVEDCPVCGSHVGWYFKHPDWDKDHWDHPHAIYAIIYDMLEEIEPEDGLNVTMSVLYS